MAAAAPRIWNAQASVCWSPVVTAAAFCPNQVIGRAGSGGGGSSYIAPSATQGSITEGVQNGNGQVVLNYIVPDSSARSLRHRSSARRAPTAGMSAT